MAIKRYNPITAGRRIMSVDMRVDVTAKAPFKPLIKRRKKNSGRNNQGKITVRHRGGGARQFVRLIDWKQNRFGISGTVQTIEQDPIRGARIALLAYTDGEKRYILVPDGVHVGDHLMSSNLKEGAEIKVGNRLPLVYLPIGTAICNIELDPGKGGQMVRGAGALASLVAIEGDFASIKLPSGEIRNVRKECLATIGQISNPDWRLVRWGKAGRVRHRGFRPTVRGKAMNPVDHPHGGGEARNSIGMKYPKTPTGRHALGVPTRRRKDSDALIVERRNKRKLK